MTRRGGILAVAAVGAALMAGACGGDNGGAASTTTATTAVASSAASAAPTSAATTAPVKMRDVTLLLPGTPGAAAGGYIAAAQPAIASKHGLNIKIVNAGQGVFNTIPQVASGQAEFSLSSTSNVLPARAENVPIVEIFAGYDYPTCVMSHPEAGVKDWTDLNGKTVAVTPGSAWWAYVKAKYHLDSVTEVAYTGSIGPWAADPNLVQQCITLNEPYVATQQGIPHEELLVSSTGFNPYQNVLFTTEDVLKNQTDLARDMVAAVAEGWTAYLADPGPTNQVLTQMGGGQSADQMAFVAKTLRDTLFSGKVGYTDPQRVEMLYGQLREVGVLKQDLDWQASFTNDFVP